MGSTHAPRGSIPVPGETWLPVGRKAFVAAAWLVPVERVRALVPPELPILPVLPGRTAVTAFLGDYGPGSTLEYHEFGVNPAVVRVGLGPAVWNHTLYVDSEASRIGGALVGARKELRTFDWEEPTPGVGTCTVRDGERPIVTMRYRHRDVPVPTFPVRAATLRGELLFTSYQSMRGDARLADVSLEAPPDSPLAWLGELGKPLVGAVVLEMRGRMMDRLRARFLPGRTSRPPPPSGR